MDTTYNENQFGLLSIEGADAPKFLQGQLTCDINKVTSTQSALGAHCNPQGRIISLFDLYLHENKYYLLMLASMIPVAMKALKKYAVFFKVTLTDATAESYLHQINPQHKNKIESGIPTIYPQTTEKFLPHEINLQYLNGISFSKGCYTGQEIIARMHYRGHLKKHMYRFSVTTHTIPSPGSDIYNQDGPCGIIVDSYQENKNHYQLLIIINDAIADSTHLVLSHENQEILTLMTLPYSF